MNFIELVNFNYEKLNDKEVINILWREIIKGEAVDCIDELIEYSFHYPVDTEAYLEELNEKFDALDKESLRTIDGRLKAYLITFLYYCTKCEDSRVSIKTSSLACVLYLKLILLPGIGKIFMERNMFKAQLYACLAIAKSDTITTSSKIYLLKRIKKYCLQEQLDLYLLKGTANTITAILIMSCNEIVEDIRKVGPLALYCVSTLREIILNEDSGVRLQYIFESLFRCLRKCIEGSIPDRRVAISIVSVLIRDVLQPELDEEKFHELLVAFCSMWGHEDYDSHKDAIGMMNLLNVQYYKEVVRKMVQFTQSKCTTRFLINIMSLLQEMAANLPPFDLNKVEVLFFCSVRNILYHLMNPSQAVCDKAIGFVKELCEMRNNQLVDNMFNQFECTGKFVTMSVEALFLALIKIAERRWTASPRNEYLLTIFARFLSHTRRVNNDLIQNAFRVICCDVTPSALKPSLPILNELFLVMAGKEEIHVSEAVLKLLFFHAMRPDMTSYEYVEHIMHSMLYPQQLNGIVYGTKFYCNIFLTSTFEYGALIAKAQTKIGDHEIACAIHNLDWRETGTAVLLDNLLDFHDYHEIEGLVTYMINNFEALSCHQSSGFLCSSLSKILDKRLTLPNDFPLLDALQSLILKSLFRESFPIPSIKPAFDLFKKIRELLGLPRETHELNVLLDISSDKVFVRLHTKRGGDHAVFMYLNEMCLLLGRPPTENALGLLETYMDDHDRITVLMLFLPDVYVQILTLFTTVGMMKRTKLPDALRHLHDNLESNDKVIKVTAFKLLYCLCEEITHEYEKIISFGLNEMVIGDPCMVRICSSVLEGLIHNDYIKLTSQDFFRFVHAIGCDDLTIYMKNLLMKRFLLSNQNDIAKYYLYCVAYMTMCPKIPNYPIAEGFVEDLIKIKHKINNPNEILQFLFEKLPVRKKFNILVDIAAIIEDLLRGQCKVDNSFFEALIYMISTFKFMIPPVEDAPKNYYQNAMKLIEKQIVNHDPHYKEEGYYVEYDVEIRRCTLVLLKLLFYENDQLAARIQTTLFDSLVHWIDFIKAEIVHYVHVERGRDYDRYFNKLVQYYKRNKGKFEDQDSFLPSL